jgi:hypothetical protein
MKKQLNYRGTASTKEEAEALAYQLLQPFMDLTKERVTTVTREYADGRQEVRLATSAAEDGAEALALPVVHILDFGGEGKHYKLYLLFDLKRLPFYFQYQPSIVWTLLPLLQPTIKPEEALPVEVVLTADGARQLQRALYDSEETVLERHIQTAREAKKEERIYTLWDNFGELSPLEVKAELEAGDYEGGIGDAELILNAVTGKTYRTEKAYLKALAAWAGADAVEKYKEEILEGYRSYKALRFADFLHHSLLFTEDYSYVEAHYKEYASAVGYKEEYAPLAHIGDGTALDAALYMYLKDYLGVRQLFDGLTEDRVAEYLNAPASTLKKLDTMDFTGL